LDSRGQQVPQRRRHRHANRRDLLCLSREDRGGGLGVDPAAILGDAERRNSVPRVAQTLNDSARRADRHLMLDASTSKNDSDVGHGKALLSTISKVYLGMANGES